MHIVYSIQFWLYVYMSHFWKHSKHPLIMFWGVKQMQVNGVSVIPIWPYGREETYSLGKLSGPGTKLGQGIKVNPEGVS